MHRDAGNLIIVVLHGVTPKEKIVTGQVRPVTMQIMSSLKKGEDFILTNILGGLTGPD